MIDDFELDVREERRRRLLYLIFTVGMIASAVICAVLLYLVTTPTQRLVELGPTNQFVVDQPQDIAVNQLETSKLIPTRSQLSDDVVYVVKQQDGSYRALLGLDPVSGCFLNWRQNEEHYVGGCTTSTYDMNGLNTVRISTTTTKPVDMVELPTVIKNDTLYIQDSILRRNIQ